jgi:glycosyltransferase involved in cell wall biosynthesis
MPVIVRQFPNIHLWLVGDGPARPELQHTCSQLGIQDHVHFAGSLPRDQVSLYLLAADLFTFPSLTESQALVLDEAQAAGLACVVTNQGGSAEAIDYGETGLVVEPEVEAFASAILRLIQDDKLRRRFSEIGARKRETLSVPAVADRVMQIYQSAMRTHEGTILVGDQP